jgi:hypothetical protein
LVTNCYFFRLENSNDRQINFLKWLLLCVSTADTLLAPDFIRLAPSVPKHFGSIWSLYANTHKEWMVELSFRISGSYYVGGRGIAFWYTKDRSEEGPVLGSKDQWNGLGIMFETADAKKKVCC